jgi:hypothetical protein
MRARPLRSRSYLAIAVMILLGVPASQAGVITPAGSTGERLARLLSAFTADRVPTGILYDRVLPISRIERYDGTAGSQPASLRVWRQIYDEMWRASLRRPDWPPFDKILSHDIARNPSGAIPIAILDFRYDRIRDDALSTGALLEENGRLVPGSGNALVSRRVFAAAPLRDHTYNGSHVAFRLDRRDIVGNRGAIPLSVRADFDDGRGFVPVDFGRPVAVAYPTTGRKTVRLQASFQDQESAGSSWSSASFYFDVPVLDTPAPDDTLDITADIPYLGVQGTGQAYVYLSDQHTTLTNPLVVPEGFDLDNTMNWPELYALLNQQQLLENLRALGFDAVVLNFTDATDYIQRNSFVLLKLIQTVQDAIPPDNSLALVGPSMGGIVARYAVAYMETHGMPHRIRNLICFDAPNRGANIPLGLQYWVAFFAGQSSDAAALLAALNAPASRQMLAYHYTDPPGATGQDDPLRDQLLADLAGVGNYPNAPRRVAIANGSGTQMDQGFAPGDSLIVWEYQSFLVDIIGDVWAVPSGSSHRIFHGLIDPIIGSPDEQIVTVSGTSPYDNAPGGYRDSMAQLDSVDTGYGDIVAEFDNHCFIPTISSLDVDTTDLFYNIAGDPDILSRTPFQAIYYPSDNQEHVEITPENEAWFLSEIEWGLSSVAELVPSGHMSILYPPAPNPLSSSTRIRFLLPHAGPAGLSVFDAAGRRVAVLARGNLGAGEHLLRWDARREDGSRAAPGIYFLRLTGSDFAASGKLTVR